MRKLDRKEKNSEKDVIGKVQPALVMVIFLVAIDTFWFWKDATIYEKMIKKAMRWRKAQSLMTRLRNMVDG